MGLRMALVTLMLGLSLALGAVSISFAEDAPAPKEEKKKKGKKSKKDDEKKEDKK